MIYTHTLYYLNKSYKVVTKDESLTENTYEQIEVSEDDKMLTYIINTCGSNKSRYKDDIIYLYKKYIHPSVNICGSCGSEIINAWKIYHSAYEKKYQI